MDGRTLDDALATVDTLSLKVVSGGKQGSFDDAVQRLAAARVVFVGETHTRYDNHLVQLALLRALYQRHPKMALGVEWFQQDVQQPLDDYLAGRISEAEMLHQTEYYQRWSYDYRLYRPIIEYAKRHAIPVLALNAPVAITRQVGKGGLASLSAADRAKLPQQLDDSDPGYRRRLRAIYDIHPHAQQPFENFLSVQMVWDESMADGAARFLKSHPDYHLLVLAGNGHAEFHDGIPDRLVRRLPVSTAGVVTVNATPTADPQTDDANLLVISPALRLPPSGKLGVLINTHKDGVAIVGVQPDSGAERAGLHTDDRIVELDGNKIRFFADLKLALMNKRPGDTVAVGVKSLDAAERRLDVVLH